MTARGRTALIDPFTHSPAGTPEPQAARAGALPWLAANWTRLRPWVLGALLLALIAVVGTALSRLLHEVRYADVLAAVRATPGSAIAGSLLFTALSYLALTSYDASALRYAEARVPRATVLVTAFVAYALGNTIGLGALTGGAVRMRLYAAAGVPPPKIARVIVFGIAAFGLGMTAFGALGVLWAAPAAAALLHLPAPLLRAGALLALAGLAGFIVLCARRRVLAFGPSGRLSLRLPPAGLAARQLVIGAVELGFSGAALWCLLPAGVDPAVFAAFYAVAVTAGVLSHLPGGVGVFEAVMLAACGPQVPAQQVFGALLLYRALYYVLPLVLATALLAQFELRAGAARFAPLAPAMRTAARLSPQMMAALAFVGGVWLLVSGVTPQADEAAELLRLHVPLILVEASHFIGSVAGLGLLVVARGLLHRVDAAWWAALGLSAVAALLAWPKGIALDEGLLLASLALLLLVSRRQFDRHSSLFADRLEPGWLVAIAGVVAACVGVLFFAYQEVPYANQLWWQFEFDAQAPRSLRALLVVFVLGGAFAFWQLLRPRAGVPALPTAADLARAEAIVRASPEAEACFALTGDKHLMFSPSGRSFLMFGREKRTWLALHGPFGDPDEAAELAWRFIETAGANGCRPAFYQVRPQTLPMFLDCGLQAFKLGEYATVPLADFSLKGGRRADLRAAVNRAQRDGLAFEVLPAGGAAARMAELREVSDAWLAEMETREKGFSVGRFDPAWLQRLPVALVLREGRVLAFANLLAAGSHGEAAIDLMRYRPDAPPGTMDYLFAQVMLHLQSEGYAHFGLGMAPLAGMAERRRAPRWQRIGRLLFEYGERFYNFQGLYRFKDKFDPDWEPRYLIAGGGTAPLLALMDAATLIGGGMKGVVSK